MLREWRVERGFLFWGISQRWTQRALIVHMTCPAVIGLFHDCIIERFCRPLLIHLFFLIAKQVSFCLTAIYSVRSYYLFTIVLNLRILVWLFVTFLAPILFTLTLTPWEAENNASHEKKQRKDEFVEDTSCHVNNLEPIVIGRIKRVQMNYVVVWLHDVVEHNWTGHD